MVTARSSPHELHFRETTMRRVPTVLILTIVSSVLAPVVVSATGAAQDKAAATVQPDRPATTAVHTGNGAEAACTRRVKVVYAGYGEGQGAPCTVTVQR